MTGVNQNVWSGRWRFLRDHPGYRFVRQQCLDASAGRTFVMAHAAA